jgi:hypothetical protein
MSRFWYAASAALLLLFAGLIWMQRDQWLSAMMGLSERPHAPQPKVEWAQIPELSSVEGSRGNPRLRHVIGRLLKPGAIANELILRFETDRDLQDFLNNTGRLTALATLPELKAVRVGYDRADDLNDVPDNADPFANFLVQLPAPPNSQGPGIQDSAVPFGGNALEWLGVTDNEQWGAGVKVAVIDTGIVDHPTFAAGEGNDRDLVAEEGVVSQVNSHGTAVASVVAGSHPAAPGVAPAADLINIRVADANGNSDSFTLAKGLLAAVDAGADVVNISLGSVGDSSVVEDAVDTAREAGMTVVAAAGNNGTDSLTYPAAYEGVISVGSVDAQGQHLDFSNRSENLDLAAPGYAVHAAWEDNERIEFTGTSASAPFVTGAIAAVMSWDPSITGAQAYELLVAQANEAGAPGADSNYGAGILNVGRVVNGDTSGIYDAGVASHYYAGDLQGNGREMLQVVVENRGTEVIYGSTLTVVSPIGLQQFTLGPMAPGEVLTRELPVDTRRAEVDGQVSYSTTITLPNNFTDTNTGDNQLTSSYAPPASDG